jgi:prepilin-type N-terminal cleavage/methylation domain-containing protein
MLKFSRRSGFTLIELLVAISIIGLLTGLLLPNFISMRKRARDAKRIQDMQEIQKAFEEYYSVNNAYADCASMSSDDYLSGGLPTDPLNSGDYAYSGDCGANGYYYCAKLEVRFDLANSDGTGGCPSSGCYFNSGATHYCVKQRQ